MFRPISRGKVLGRERGGGYLAQSESIAGSELRMAHLLMSKTKSANKIRFRINFHEIFS